MKDLKDFKEFLSEGDVDLQKDGDQINTSLSSILKTISSPDWKSKCKEFDKNNIQNTALLCTKRATLENAIKDAITKYKEIESLLSK
jgi:hypothetical protein